MSTSPTPLSQDFISSNHVSPSPEWTVKDRIKDLPRKLIQGMKGISVEISALLYATAASGSRLIYQQLLLEKCCIYQLGYSKDVCDHLNDHDNQDAENASQKLAARFNMYDSLIEYVIPVFVALFVGNWTDIHGRKPLIVFCFVATLIQQVGMIANVAYMSWNPIYMSVLSSLPFSVGAFTTFLMLVFSYLGDITTPSQRTVRLAILNLFLYAGQPMGNLTGAHIFETYGYNVVFYYFMAVAALGGIYSAVRLDSDTHNRSKSPINGSGDVGDKPRSHSTRKKLRDLMNVRGNVKEAFKTFFRPREGSRRLVLILMAVTLLIGLLPLYGEYSIDFLYLKKRLGWSVSQISLYNTYRTCMQVVGTLTCTPLLKLVLKWEDTKVGGLAVCLQTFSRLLHAFATVPWMFYSSGALYLLSTVKAAVTRSIISKVVEPQELGKAYAIIGFSEAIVPMVAGVVYAESYRATVDFFPGTPYLISSACWLITGIIYFAIHVAHDEYAVQEKMGSKVINECDDDGAVGHDDVESSSESADVGDFDDDKPSSK